MDGQRRDGYNKSMTTLQEILDAAQSLPVGQRVELIHALWETMPPADSPSPSPEWIAEAQRRSEELDAGRMTSAPWPEVREWAQRGRPGWLTSSSRRTRCQMMRLIRKLGRARLETAPAYDRAIFFSIIVQVIVSPPTVVLLGGGAAALGMVAILAGYWIVAAIIILRRPLSPSKGDVAFVRWGFLLLAVLFVFVCLSLAILPL